MADGALLLILLLGLTSYCSATMLKVGDDKGWTIMGSVNYSAWASTKKFKIGDVIGKFQILLVNYMELASFFKHT
jgi:Plastocyanin-like domain